MIVWFIASVAKTVLAYSTVIEKPVRVPSTTLTIVYDHELGKGLVSSEIKSAIESSFITKQIIYESVNLDQIKYSFCISPTACYTHQSDSTATAKVLLNNKIIFNDPDIRSIVSFGYSPDGIKPNSCEDYTICDRILKPDTLQRNLVDLITKFSKISSSEQTQSICWWLDDIDKRSAESQQDMVNVQRYILVLLYISTDGLHWHDQNKWLSEDSVCNWFGVFCEVPGIVSKIELTANKMQGHIPIELGELAGLETLIMHSNQLTGNIPIELVKLQNLKKLILSKNMFSGSIHSEIKYLEELRYLDISTNRLTNTIPTEIATLYMLEYISIANNSLFGTIPEELKNLVNLKSIVMADNMLRGSAPIINSMTDLGKNPNKKLYCHST